MDLHGWPRKYPAERIFRTLFRIYHFSLFQESPRSRLFQHLELMNSLMASLFFFLQDLKRFSLENNIYDFVCSFCNDIILRAFC